MKQLIDIDTLKVGDLVMFPNGKRKHAVREITAKEVTFCCTQPDRTQEIWTTSLKRLQEVKAFYADETTEAANA